MIEEAKVIKDNPDVVTDLKVLKQISKQTTKEECDKLNIWGKLNNTLAKHPNGVGLSAIQIGHPLRAAIYYIESNGKPFERRLLNPTIVDSYKMMKMKDEGCLSFPGKSVNTIRYAELKVQDDFNGLQTLVGMEAIIVQHEIDHMEGLTMFDRKGQETFKRSDKKVGRNDLCPCGSGKKSKKCCK